MQLLRRVWIRAFYILPRSLQAVFTMFVLILFSDLAMALHTLSGAHGFHALTLSQKLLSISLYLALNIIMYGTLCWWLASRSNKVRYIYGLLTALGTPLRIYFLHFEPQFISLPGIYMYLFYLHSLLQFLSGLILFDPDLDTYFQVSSSKKPTGAVHDF